MSTENTPQEPDYLKRAAGTFAALSGIPADAARALVLNRVGVPLRVPELDDKGNSVKDEKGKPVKIVHPLRAKIDSAHASAPAEPYEILPTPFPPENFDGPLKTGGDYLDLIDATVKAQKADADAKQKAQADKDAAKAAKSSTATDAPS